jgi:hypothetical protein
LAIAREKQIKGWRREKKEALIKSVNPEWKSLNSKIFDEGEFEELMELIVNRNKSC